MELINYSPKKEKITDVLHPILQKLRPAIRGLMIGTTAHLMSENTSMAFTIAGVVSAKSILGELARSNDIAFWANFFLETGIATVLITQFQDEVIAAFFLASQLVTEIYQTIGAPQQLIEITKMFDKFPTEVVLLLVFLIISNRSLGLLAKKVVRGTSKNSSST